MIWKQIVQSADSTGTLQFMMGPIPTSNHQLELLSGQAAKWFWFHLSASSIAILSPSLCSTSNCSSLLMRPLGDRKWLLKYLGHCSFRETQNKSSASSIYLSQLWLLWGCRQWTRRQKFCLCLFLCVSLPFQHKYTLRHTKIKEIDIS